VQWIVVGGLVVGALAVRVRLALRGLRPSPGGTDGCTPTQCSTCKHFLTEAERGGCVLGRVPEDEKPGRRGAD